MSPPVLHVDHYHLAKSKVRAQFVSPPPPAAPTDQKSNNNGSAVVGDDDDNDDTSDSENFVEGLQVELHVYPLVSSTTAVRYSPVIFSSLPRLPLITYVSFLIACISFVVLRATK